MKRQLRLTCAFLVCSLCGLAPTARAAITGQWDFKSGTYNSSSHPSIDATIGQAVYPADNPTATGTQFGSTTTFGIAAIGGQPTNVMQFPRAADSYGGYIVPVGASPNGGGGSVNQYTVIMDVLFTNTPAAGKTFTLFGTDYNGFGGEFFVTQSGAVGYSGGAGGSLTPNAWHRIAIAVDLTNTVSGLSICIDGTNVLTAGAPSAVDGTFSIVSYMTLFDDPNTNSESGYIASLQFDDQKLPDGFLATLGSPVAAGILTGPPPSPWVVSVAPTDDLRFPGRSTIPPTPLIQIVLNDGTATVNTNTIALKFNGTTVTPGVAYAAPTTTITYQVPTPLPSTSRNAVALNYQDSASNHLGVDFSFDVGTYIGLPASAANPVSSANTPGFIYRVAQAPSWAALGNNLTRAQQQLDGTLLNPTNGVPFGNEAALSGPGEQADGSFFVDQYEGNSGTIAFSTHDPAGYPGILDFTAYPFPGIPGTNGSQVNFADDVVAYLQLDAGTHVFGVAVGATRVDTPPDNGYALFCGANPRDLFSTLVGQYVRTTPNFSDNIANTNTFTFFAPVSGIYPFRLVHWENTSEADLAWYYVDPASGANILINDPSGAIPAYRVSTIPREPYVAEVYPSPGGQGFLSSAPIVVILSDDDLKVGTNSIKLYLNGAPVTPNSISKTNTLTTVTYHPNALRTTVTNLVQLVYGDNASPTPRSFTNSWSFTIVVAGPGVPEVTGQWDFNGDLKATVGKDLQYFDGPNGQTAATVQFGTCSQLGIPLIHGADAQVMSLPGFADGTALLANYGFMMTPGIAPNGGGLLVNQYTIIYDMYYSGGVIPFFNCQNTNMPHGIDGSLFLQNGDMGQGSGGYTMNHGAISNGWHRLAFAVDLSQNLITKWVDGVKAQDWVSSANGLDAPRRAWQANVVLFGDNDGPNNSGDDHSGSIYVSSIQVRSGKLSDADMVLLGGPSAGKIPQDIPATTVTGQWDFNYGDLEATVGKDLQYFDGPTGQTAATVQFGSCSQFGIPPIHGVDASVLSVPGFPDGTPLLANYGFLMTPLIAPNGGGNLVNQYTIVYDMYYTGGVIPFFQCQNTNMPHGIDGSLFLQDGDMGQGSGGYTMDYGPVTNGWHRLAFAVDLSQNLITKWVDGVKAQDWVSSANSLDAPRRAWQAQVVLFGDNDGPSNSGDDHSGSIYVKSIQVSSQKLSDVQMMVMGGPGPYGIPIAVPTLDVLQQGGQLTLSWPAVFSGFTLYSTTNLANPSWTPVPGVDYVHNTVTLPIGAVPGFFQLVQ